MSFNFILINENKLILWLIFKFADFIIIIFFLDFERSEKKYSFYTNVFFALNAFTGCSWKGHCPNLIVIIQENVKQFTTIL